MLDTNTRESRVLMYLLKILGPYGRQMLKDKMMQRVEDEPEARWLLDAINEVERGLGQLAKMTPEERAALREYVPDDGGGER